VGVCVIGVGGIDAPELRRDTNYFLIYLLAYYADGVYRSELGITFTKLHCWRLIQFKKGVFLDADTLVLRNIDDLFQREELSAAPDAGWPDCFNTGVFVFV